LGRRAIAKVHKFGDYFLGILLGGPFALQGLDSLEHWGNLGNILPWHLGQDVPVKVEDAALPV